MQSIENLLSPAGESVDHEFAFESKSAVGIGNKDPSVESKMGVQNPGPNQDDDPRKSLADKNGVTSTVFGAGCGSSETSEYSCSEMAEYDVDPLPLDALLSHETAGAAKSVLNATEKGTRSRGIVLEQKSHWQKKDVVTKGQYKPWFFSRFAKSRIPLGKPQCLADLKSITTSCRNMKVKYDESEKGGGKGRRNKAKDDSDEEVTDRRRKVDTTEDDEDDDEAEEEELWVECENCKKWRKVPPGIEIDQEKSFFCQMLPSVTCETPEEDWDEEETEWVEDNGAQESSGGKTSKSSQHASTPEPNSRSSQAPSGGSGGGGGGCGMNPSSGGANKKRKALSGSGKAEGGKGGEGKESKESSSSTSPSSASTCSSSINTSSSKSPVRPAKVRKTSPEMTGIESEEPLSPEDITAASSLYAGGAGQHGTSRLAAVVRVLSATGRAMHYDLLTRQALRLGLIRFTGSQGTAGESMKAFLNKTIRENKTAAVVNLGKGVYGLKEWQVGTASCGGEREREGCPPGPVPTAWQSQGDGCSGAVSPNL
eukprot:CAMPEP_0181300938 /NCGR_PEP_ID=MMETSP1101-20121128/7158_1 /TAXON_ID=46948 /ORGANISM="Rhodomonas abbreviata, Strain Caron Lab Isolate" /LENGTH=538 /DNA_ID=CAMNT_0023406211 /DNA_START=269 /DNA_END=1882 /DNA_ORIENTATION=+